MPLFKLYCQRCRKYFKAFLPLSEAKEGAPCPSCGQRAFDPSLGFVEGQPQPGAVGAGASCALPQRD